MKRILSLSLCICLLLMLPGCAQATGVKRSIKGNFKTYEEMLDGTWRCDGRAYAYRLEIKGQLNQAACDSVYVYLSNRPSITFEQAWRASGLSSSMADYFSLDEAVLVETRTE